MDFWMSGLLGTTIGDFSVFGHYACPQEMCNLIEKLEQKYK